MKKLIHSSSLPWLILILICARAYGQGEDIPARPKNLGQNQQVEGGKAHQPGTSEAEGNFIVGHVVDKETGRAIQDFRIHTRITAPWKPRSCWPRPKLRSHESEARNPEPEGTSCAREKGGCFFHDEEGMFRIEQEALGGLDFFVSAKGYVQSNQNRVNWRREDRQTFVVKLDRKGKNLSGVVRDNEGQPIAGAEVYLFGRAIGNNNLHVPTDLHGEGFPPQDPQLWKKGVTGADGVYRFSLIPDNYKLELVATARERATVQVDLQKYLQEEESKLNITLCREARVTVRLNRMRYPKKCVVIYRFEPVRRIPGQRFQQIYDAEPGEDTFELTGLGAGSYQFLIREHQAKGTPDRFIEHLEVVEGATEEINFGFGERYRISGQVWMSGLPLTPGLVLLTNDRWAMKSAHLDDDGFFSFEDLEADAYTLVASRNTDLIRPGDLKHPPQAQTVTLTDQDVFTEIRIQRRGNLSGTLPRLPDNRNVHLYDITSGRSLNAIDKIGSKIKMNELAPGEYSLRQGLWEIVPPFTMPADGSDVDLGKIKRPAAGSLRLLTSEPNVRLQITVRVKDLFDESLSNSYFDRDSPVLIKALPEGTHLVHLSLENEVASFLEDRITVDIVAGKETAIYLPVLLNTALRFSIVAEENKAIDPERLAEVSISNREETYVFGSEQTPLPDGYVLRLSGDEGFAKHLQEGTWTLIVRTKNGVVSEDKIVLVAGELLKVLVKLPDPRNND